MRVLQHIKRHAFLYFFLTLQVIFVVWITSASSGVNSTDDAEATGSGIAGFIVLIIWFLVDMILGVSYSIYRLATRSRK